MPAAKVSSSTATATSPDEARLGAFVEWFGTHITGDEKSQAQIFVDRLFVAFGQAGCLDVGGSPEFRVKKRNEDGGGTSFADYVWKPVVVLEMKKRGTPLKKHYEQLFRYWERLVPHRPRYAVLCNFDEFWIYDFDDDVDTPKDVVKTKELVQRWGPLAFLAPGSPSPKFAYDRVAVTREAADKLALLFNKLVEREVESGLAQRFTLQLLMALFAEDIGLLPKYFLSELVEECTNPSLSFDLLGGLFDAMNAPPAGGRFRAVSRFNGGLFAEPAAVELRADEVLILHDATTYDWSKVQPEIFGTLFQHSLGKAERHAFGAHFTHPSDIMKIVRPTIIEPWRRQIDGAKTLTRLSQLLYRLSTFRVLDPACGCGNFLYVAYRELKRLEMRVLERMGEFKSEEKRSSQQRLSLVGTENFHGIDIIPFAVEIAKVTLMIGRKLAIDEFHTSESALPLGNLDRNFEATDALIRTDGSPTTWPRCDVVIGNPPFLGTKRLAPERGTAYVKTVRRAYPGVPGMADYCVYWFRKTHDHLQECTTSDLFSGRAGLVGTQNVRNNQSRVGGLDHIVRTGTIIEAVDNQPWSGEANVNVSIVNWIKSLDSKVLPAERLLWFQIPNSGREKRRLPVDLNVRKCRFINSSLTDAVDVSGAKPLECNMTPQVAFQGVTPGHNGFVLAPKRYQEILSKDPSSKEVTFPYLIGRELLSGDGRPRRYLIDFGDASLLDAKAYPGAFAQIEKTVLATRSKKADRSRDSAGRAQGQDKQLEERWWHLWRDRADMKQAFSSLNGRYLAGSRTQRWPFVFCFVSTRILPGDKLQLFALDDDYSFGILQASPHCAWYKAKAARLKNEVDYNYSRESIFDTYPWPQQPTARQVEAIANCGRVIRRVREKHRALGGLRDLYATLLVPGINPLREAHLALDAAVYAAYGFDESEDVLAQLLELNERVSEKLRLGRQVTAPGIPDNASDEESLVTTDCVSL